MTNQYIRDMTACCLSPYSLFVIRVWKGLFEVYRFFVFQKTEVGMPPLLFVPSCGCCCFLLTFASLVRLVYVLGRTKNSRNFPLMPLKNIQMCSRCHTAPITHRVFYFSQIVPPKMDVMGISPNRLPGRSCTTDPALPWTASWEKWRAAPALCALWGCRGSGSGRAPEKPLSGMLRVVEGAVKVLVLAVGRHFSVVVVVDDGYSGSPC